MKKANITKFLFLICHFTLTTSNAYSQGIPKIYGIVSTDNIAVVNATVLIKNTPFSTSTNSKGYYSFFEMKEGKYTVVVLSENFRTRSKEIVYYKNSIELNFALDSLLKELNGITVTTYKNRFSTSYLEDIGRSSINAGRKTELIKMEQLNANLATNNTRQIFAKIPGLNVIQIDPAGVQLGISVRGLNPNRTIDFNVRQNGYDIAADALGYNESYYSPPAQAIEQIEIVRGAASLQYGPQFGGLVNFVLRKPTPSKKIEFYHATNVGSFGLFNSYNQLSGTIKNFSYIGYFDYKRGNGFRANSGFNLYNGHLNLSYQIHKNVKISTEYTGMNYGMQQAGGLTDSVFQLNPYITTRNRNWFSTTWNLLNVNLDIEASKNIHFNLRMFGLLANRYSLGTLQNPSQIDKGGARDLLKDNYQNIGGETRVLWNYNLLKKQSYLLVGFRFYRGNTLRQQGLGSNAYNANYSYNNPDSLENSRFNFPSINTSLFAENTFYLLKNLSITPGIRIEYIETKSKGYFRNGVSLVNEAKRSKRIFPLLGLSLSYKPKNYLEVYGSFAQNYAAVNFNDIRVVNPNQKVDSNLKDVKGYNAEIGLRGTFNNIFTYDINGYYLAYNNRIGSLQKTDAQLNVYQYRTNVSDSRSIGTEAFVELDILALIFGNGRKGNLQIFESFSYTDARYTRAANKNIENKKVEYAPAIISRSGISYAIKGFKVALQYSYTSLQYSDAQNTIYAPQATAGIIPSYQILDLNAQYKLKDRYQFSAGVNNMLNKSYFNRRATGYPGPGIIPAEMRNFYVGFSVKLF